MRVRVDRCRWAARSSLGLSHIDFISITHSIPEPNLLAIRTPLGLIAHTGDWKLDPEPLLGENTDAAAHPETGR